MSEMELTEVERKAWRALKFYERDLEEWRGDPEVEALLELPRLIAELRKRNSALSGFLAPGIFK